MCVSLELLNTLFIKLIMLSSEVKTKSLILYKRLLKNENANPTTINNTNNIFNINNVSYLTASEIIS
jgi:hypothetical protein